MDEAAWPFDLPRDTDNNPNKKAIKKKMSYMKKKLQTAALKNIL